MTYFLGTSRGRHREQMYSNLVMFEPENAYLIDGIRVVVARLSDDNKWWIIPEYSFDEDKFEDRGPYETVDQAVVVFKLVSSPLWPEIGKSGKL